VSLVPPLRIVALSEAAVPHPARDRLMACRTAERSGKAIAAVRAGSGWSHGKTGLDHVACAGRGLGYTLSIPLMYPTILLTSAESTSE